MQCPSCKGSEAECNLCAGSGDYIPDWNPGPCLHVRKVEGFAAGTLYCKDCPAKILRNFDGSERVVSL